MGKELGQSVEDDGYYDLTHLGWQLDLDLVTDFQNLLVKCFLVNINIRNVQAIVQTTRKAIFALRISLCTHTLAARTSFVTLT